MKHALIGALCVLASGCGRDTSLQGVRLWQGNADCEVCQATALDMQAYQGDTLVLVRDSVYTTEVRLRVGTHDERCIYKFTTVSWLSPGLTTIFKCWAEEPVLTETFSTAWERPVPREETGQFNISVREYDAVERRQLTTLFARRFTVVWQQQEAAVSE